MKKAHKNLTLLFVCLFLVQLLSAQKTDSTFNKNRFLLSYGFNEWNYFKIAPSEGFQYENKNWRSRQISFDFQRQFKKHIFYNVGLQYMELPIRNVVTFNQADYRDYFTDVDTSVVYSKRNVTPQFNSKIVALNLLVGYNFELHKKHEIGLSVGLSKYWFIMDRIQNIQYDNFEDYLKQDPKNATFAFTINEPTSNILMLFNSVPFRLDYLNKSRKIKYGVGISYNWNPGVFIRNWQGFVFLPNTEHRRILQGEMNGSFFGIRIFVGL
jgi:hypothetical protein